MSLIPAFNPGSADRPVMRQSLTLTRGSVCLPGQFAVALQAQAMAPGRLRIYRSDNDRLADLARTVDVRPAAGSGLLLETVHTAQQLAVQLSPCPTLVPASDAVFVQWDGPDTTLTLEVIA